MNVIYCPIIKNYLTPMRVEFHFKMWNSFSGSQLYFSIQHFKITMYANCEILSL